MTLPVWAAVMTWPWYVTGRRRAGCVRAVALVLMTLTTGCAPSFRISGVTGPLEWQAVDLELTRRQVNSQGEMDVYDFTLVLREIRGVGLTFTQVKREVYQPGSSGAGGESTDRLELPAHCELRLPFSSAGFTAPLWSVVLTGTSERNEPVQITIDLVLPADPLRPGAETDVRARSGTRAPASPTGAAAPAAPDGLLPGLSGQERRRSQVVTATVNLGSLDALFSARGSRTVLPLSGAMVTFDTRIPPGLRHGLRNVAAALVPGTLRANSTLALQLDLSPYGGEPAAFRFTHVTPDPRSGQCARQIFIEPASLGGDVTRSGARREDTATLLGRHGFRLGAGWSDQEREALGDVLRRLPVPLLTLVEGLAFNRARGHPIKSEHAGEYASNTHTITIFDSAFVASMTRFGSLGHGTAHSAAASIAHEIGHAVDLTPLRLAADRYQHATAALGRAFGRYETPPGSGHYLIPPAERAGWDNLHQQVMAARQAMEEARSASGVRWQLQPGAEKFHAIDEEGQGESASEFRRAAEMDGPVRITEYADKDWIEYFAECFALYIVDPETLRWLRPAVHAYFASRFPR